MRIRDWSSDVCSSDLQVVGLDLTEVYCQTARQLSQRVRLDEQTRFLCADALQLPFAEASFDLVWTQHAAMNIADKAGLYREVARVLKPGGRSEEHTSELQPLMRISYAVFCLKKTKQTNTDHILTRPQQRHS